MEEPIDIGRFENLFRANYKFLCLVSFRIVKDNDTAQDVVQEFFMNIWQRKETLKIESSFQAYASRAVKNISISHLQKEKKKSTLDRLYGEKEAAAGQDVFDGFIELEKMDMRVMNMVERLPEDRRKIFLSYVVDGLSYLQIAEKYNISINTVKTQMKRAYAFLKSNISDDAMGLILLSIIHYNR